MRKIPKDLQGIFWSRKTETLDPKRDKNYIIHQILAYGNSGQIQWLFKIFSQKEIRKTFLESPRKVYTPAAFNFVKNYTLGLEKRKIKPDAYIKTLF